MIGMMASAVRMGAEQLSYEAGTAAGRWVPSVHRGTVRGWAAGLGCHIALASARGEPFQLAKFFTSR